MQIAANTLLVVLIPLTILTTLAFRETYRVSGPDIMGPAFFFVVSLGVRWIMAAAALGMLAARGAFDGLASPGAIQFLCMCVVFFAVDCAAASAVMAIAPKHSTATSALKYVAGFIGYGLPPVLIVLMWVVQATSPASTLIRTALPTLLVACIVCIPLFMAQVKRTKDAQQEANAQWYRRQQQLIDEGSAKINAMPADVALENLLPYLIEDWPTEVRSLVFERLNDRQNVEAELISMLADDRRELAINYLARVSSPISESLARAILEASLELARQWQGRQPGISTEDAEKLAVDCGHCTEMAYACKVDSVDFHPAIDAWEKVLGGAPQIDSITMAANSLGVWRKYHPPDAASVAH